METQLYGSIEAGGTKFIVGVLAAPDDVRAMARIETTTADATIGAAIAWLRSAQAEYGTLSAIGIASFGPLQLDGRADNWGFITQTTKAGWSNSDFGARVMSEMGLKVGFDTDVNGAALAESRWGAAIGQRVSLYLTVGTGIGGGAIIDGKPLHGLSHPEMGHITPRRHLDDQQFAGICPFHGDCLEGLASGPAIKARWGKTLSELPDDHCAHGIIAWYLAQMVVTLQSIMEPGRVVLGGGVMATPGLIERIRNHAADLGKGYFCGDPREIIVPPLLGNNAGLLGGLALAQDIVS